MTHEVKEDWELVEGSCTMHLWTDYTKGLSECRQKSQFGSNHNYSLTTCVECLQVRLKKRPAPSWPLTNVNVSDRLRALGVK